jgi:hypothetical protein
VGLEVSTSCRLESPTLRITSLRDKSYDSDGFFAQGLRSLDTNMQEDLPDHGGPIGMEEQAKCSEEQITSDNDAHIILEEPVRRRRHTNTRADTKFKHRNGCR